MRHPSRTLSTQIGGAVALAVCTVALIAYSAMQTNDGTSFVEYIPPVMESTAIPTVVETNAEETSAETAAPVFDRTAAIDAILPRYTMLNADTLVALPDDVLATLAETTAGETDASHLRRLFYDAVGMTPLAYLAQVEDDAKVVVRSTAKDGPASLVFTGDVNLGEDFTWCPIHRLADDAVPADFLLPPLDAMLSDADLCVINLECTVSKRGAPKANKKYTFRAKPESLSLLTTMGVDLVTLANNHVGDWGDDALVDTVAHLDDADIASVGAGDTIERASDYRAFVVDGIKIGFVAASNAEKFRLTPAADADSPGILAMYDPTAFYAAVERAKAENDLVICLVHWGTENSTVVNDNQRELTSELIARGADAIVGHHPHVLQDAVVYEAADGRAVPVLFSLGNFWFNTAPNDTALGEILVDWDGDALAVSHALYPCRHEAGISYLVDEEIS